jgi:hypothetical protein
MPNGISHFDPNALSGASENPNVAGVFGTNTAGGVGVAGQSNDGSGFLGGKDPVFGQQVGVYGQSDQQGVMGLSTALTGTGVYGGNTGGTGSRGIGVRGETLDGVGVQGQCFGDGIAAKFIGSTGRVAVEITGGPLSAVDIDCTGDITAGGKVTAFDVVLRGADCAEDFNIAGTEVIDPGTVMVLDCAGDLRACDSAYDKKVMGVISGAGNCQPGILLGKRLSAEHRLPLALVGKVYCKVDAEFGSIEVGDLLTTSATTGHAMKAGDPTQAFGSVIGKALRPMSLGRGLIPILVALQ